MIKTLQEDEALMALIAQSAAVQEEELPSAVDESSSVSLMRRGGG